MVFPFTWHKSCLEGHLWCERNRATPRRQELKLWKSSPVKNGPVVFPGLLFCSWAETEKSWSTPCLGSGGQRLTGGSSALEYLHEHQAVPSVFGMWSAYLLALYWHLVSSLFPWKSWPPYPIPSILFFHQHWIWCQCLPPHLRFPSS